MDIYCKRCGEPWDIDYFHDVADDTGSTFDTVREAFYRDGCKALGETRCEASPSMRGDIAALAYELMGDDVDGAAAMLDDAEYMGLF